MYLYPVKCYACLQRLQVQFGFKTITDPRNPTPKKPKKSTLTPAEIAAEKAAEKADNTTISLFSDGVWQPITESHAKNVAKLTRDSWKEIMELVDELMPATSSGFECHVDLEDD